MKTSPQELGWHMVETTGTVKDLGAVFDAHVRAEFVDKDVGRDDGHNDG
jgi:hypothetical protein